MHANLPEIAKRWEKDYASGGIARVGYQKGMGVAPFPNPILNNMQSMKPLALDVMTGQHQPGISPHRGGYNPIDPYGNIQMDLEKDDIRSGANVQQQPAWYNRMFNKVGQGITGLKNKFTGAYDTSQNFLKNILDNTMIGRVMAGFDATNPRAFNYNPALQGQIDFMKGQNQYGIMDQSGLNKITGGVLAGKNLQSMLGSNDLGAMYDKSIAQTEKTLAGLLEEDEEGNIGYGGNWSNLAKTNPAAFQKKVAIHKARLKKKQDEYNVFKAHQDKIRQEKINRERAAGAAANQATQRRAGRGGDHMSRSRDQGGLGISKSQAQAVSDANRAAGMGGWGLAKGGLASLWPR